MHRYTQAHQFLEVRTSRPNDDLLIERFWGQEAISSLFSFHLDLLAENNTEIPFDKLIGENATVEVRLPNNKKRYFSGIISRLSEGTRGSVFTTYFAELVPKFWLLTRTARSRIFPMKLTVPQILEEVLGSLSPRYDWDGEFAPRDYCVQYHETDFSFANRLMEEEGIYYFFEHLPNGDQMVVTNKLPHPAVDEPSEIFYKQMEGGPPGPNHIYDWTKSQELRSGRYTMWDYTFQLPRNNLEGKAEIIESQSVGQINHQLKLPANQDTEIYEFPGEYAQRFDAIDKAGNENMDELKKITTDEGIKADNQRTTEIRMQAEALQSFRIRGSSTCPQFLSAHTFTLRQHFNADDNYLITSVEHFSSVGSAYRSGAASNAVYQNTFSCLPSKLAFRPARVTPKPIIHGTQTAYVVGPSGKEIFTDKFGRVKVQFHWDRAGKYDAESACWIRVAQAWAGKRWGASFWPRIGQEVIVAFEEGDPDQPIIVGSVYNPDQMPPYLGDGPDPKHKSDNKVSGIKSNSTPGGQGYNEIRFDDTKDKEQVFIHAQRAMDLRMNGSWMTTVGGSINFTNGGVDKDGNKFGDARQLVNKDYHLHTKGDSFVLTDGVESHIVTGDAFDWYRQSHRTTVADEEFLEAPSIIFEGGQTISLKAPTIILDAGQQVSIKGPGGFITIDASGITIQGLIVKINSGGGPALNATPSSGIGSGNIADKAKEPKDPAGADNSRTGQRSSR